MGLYDNPNYTIPMPASSGMPVALWSATQIRLTWVLTSSPGPVPPDGDVYTALWRTPIFDLRPDLRSAQGGPKVGVPIWNKSARLYAQFYGLTAVNALNKFVVTTVESGAVVTAYAHGANPPTSPPNAGIPNQTPLVNVVPVTAPVDCTAEFMLGVGQPDSVVLVTAPLGESYPVRYWAIEYTFKKTLDTTVVPVDIIPPIIVVEAGMY